MMKMNKNDVTKKNNKGRKTGGKLERKTGI